MSQVTEQSVRFQTALASIKLIQASAVLDLTEDDFDRSEERFSRNAETDLVCRLLLEKKKKDRIEHADQKPLRHRPALALAQPALGHLLVLVPELRSSVVIHASCRS